MPPSKKRKIASPPPQPEIIPSPQPEVIVPAQPEVIAPAQPEVITPTKRVMSIQEKQNIASELESFEGEIPEHILDFLRQHSSNGKESEEGELEIDIDDLSDDTMFKLRKLLDDSLMEKQNNEAKVEACEIEVFPCYLSMN
jgi:hypothetical protein